MPKKHVITEEQIAELEKARKECKNKREDRRLKALLLYAEGMKQKKIAEQCEFAETYISELVCKYKKRGIEGIIGSKYGGNHRNLSYEAEEALLAPFMQAAQAGEIVEVSAIKKAYEQAIGRSVDTSHGHIYSLLHRHEWRKVMPRSQHPKKASEEEIAASKKLTNV